MRFAAWFCLACIVTYSYDALANPISSAQVVERTLRAASSCLQWRWIGNCFWLTCDLTGCGVTTSAKVQHYRPDLLIAVYPTPELLPVVELRTVLKSVQGEAIKAFAKTTSFGSFAGGGGPGITSSRTYSQSNLHFFEATVAGHPLDELPAAVDQFLCDGITEAFDPYYQSAFDFAQWRFGIVDVLNPASYTPGEREIGLSAATNWGSVYPRTGFVLQQSPVKAAAVVAQRACDIVINDSELHVVNDLPEPPTHTEVATPLRENNHASGLWQMIVPQVSSTCELFGSTDVDWDYLPNDHSRTYVWNLWRRYECCQVNGDFYIGDIDF